MTAGGTRPSFPFSAVVGQDGLRLALILLAVDPGIGGVLIRGQKGTAKTTAVRGLAALVPSSDGGSRAPFVELPLGATEDRVVGSLDLEALADSGRPSFRPGLVSDAHGGLLYVDEVNLLADHLVDVLLDAAASGLLTVERDGVSHTAPARFALVGTMNPEEGELRPQLLDRFGLAVDVVGSDDAAERVEIVRRRRAYEADPEGFAARHAAADSAVGAEIAAARALLASVTVPDRELTRIALVCLEVGVEGMRADVVIARTAAAHAALRGRDRVTEEDVRVGAELALPHRRRRDPFDPAEMDPGELDRAMDAADEQLGPEEPDDDPDPGPDDGPGGPDGDGTDGAGPSPAAGPEKGGPAADAPTEPTAQSFDRASDAADGDLSPDALDAPDASETPAAPARGGATPDARRAAGPTAVLRLEGTGRGAVGRRSRAITSTGRLVASPSTSRGARLHVLDTVRTAMIRRVGEAHSGGGADAVVARDDLRWGVRHGREGNLVVFLVDTSGSMAARRRLDAVTGSCVALLRDAYVRRDLVAVVEAHGSAATVAVPPTRSVDVAVTRLGNVGTGGRTPLAEGLSEVARLLERRRVTEPDRRALLVVLTDGRATAGADAMDRALAAARGLRARRLAAPVVVDCESGRVRLGAAATLARELGAEVIALDELAEDTVARIVRAA